MPFELYRPRRGGPINVTPLITLTKMGYLYVNGCAFEFLKNPDRVLLHYDVERMLIGLQPVSTGTPDSYKVSQQGKQATHHIAGVGFLKYYGLPFGEQIVKFKLHWEDDIAVLTPVDEAYP